MTPSEFRSSLKAVAPPSGLSAPLAALWWDAKGAWDLAHEAVASDETGAASAWVHGYLHRKEGDAGNARYWYARAGRPVPGESSEHEWSSIATALLSQPVGEGA